MNVLVIGSGGREHALILGLQRSPSVEAIYAIPGNGGIASLAEVHDVDVKDGDAVAGFCRTHNIDLVVIGPEEPLVNGLGDLLRRHGYPVFGPSEKAAAIEGSKIFMKEKVISYGIPTALYQEFTDKEAAKSYIRAHGAPIVVKTDGLAAGKGVTVAFSEEEACTAIEESFAGKFGDAGKKIIVEEFLEGEEVSFFAISDGNEVVSFGTAQDHKQVGEGDTGPNTGGMGAYAPAPIVTPAMHDRIMNEVITPFVEGMAADGMAYTGVIFAGLMIDKKGNPKLIEFNVRFGDPECQVLIPRLESDLGELLLAASTERLDEVAVKFSNRSALCVVMAANGYPGSYQKGSQIHNLDTASRVEDVTIYHAGTRYDGLHYTAHGGRVLGVTALGDSVKDAKDKAYKAVSYIDWPEGFYRNDIGWKALT